MTVTQEMVVELVQLLVSGTAGVVMCVLWGMIQFLTSGYGLPLVCCVLHWRDIVKYPTVFVPNLFMLVGLLAPFMFQEYLTPPGISSETPFDEGNTKTRDHVAVP